MTSVPAAPPIHGDDTTGMTKHSLVTWAHTHGEHVNAAPDKKLSITSRLVRFRWQGDLAVAVGIDADGKTRINALVDAVALGLARDPADAGPIHLILGTRTTGAIDPALTEPIDAIGTLVTALEGHLDLRLWTLAPGGDPVPLAVRPSVFTTATPARWTAMLMAAAVAPVDGLAASIAARLAHRPEFALYPKLSSLRTASPWQMRLDGLEIGRAGRDAATIALNSRDLTERGEPRSTWQEIVGGDARTFTADTLDDLAHLVERLIEAWHQLHAAVLGHGQAEHALEAHLLNGRIALHTDDAGPLRLAVPVRHGMIAAAQFPTLWGNVTRPARYLDALLADDHGRPWAIELKDQDAGGGHGSYLRHGVAQAVLYRHYIRSAPALDPWFAHHALDHTQCQAALAFPTAATSTATTMQRLRQLADLFDIDVIEFPRPGHPAPE